jgi:hypothetical protein
MITVLERLTFVSARRVITAEEAFPAQPATYLFLFRGGNRLLGATSYFALGGKRPPSFRRKQHLYTGAAMNLRRRIKQHMAQINGSSLRRTLLAIELSTGAISQSKTPRCEVRGERSLTEWMAHNLLVGFVSTQDPFDLEGRLLAELPSPFNLTLRRTQRYARALSALRLSVFPSGDTKMIGALSGR